MLYKEKVGGILSKNPIFRNFVSHNMLCPFILVKNNVSKATKNQNFVFGKEIMRTEAFWTDYTITYLNVMQFGKAWGY